MSSKLGGWVTGATGGATGAGAGGAAGAGATRGALSSGAVCAGGADAMATDATVATLDAAASFRADFRVAVVGAALGAFRFRFDMSSEPQRRF